VRLRDRVALVMQVLGYGPGRLTEVCPRGAHVIVTDLDESAAKETRPDRGRRRLGRAHQLDVRDLARSRRSSKSRAHPRVLHVLYNHAASRSSGLDVTSEESTSRRHQPEGCFFVAQAAVDLLKRAEVRVRSSHGVDLGHRGLSIQPALLDDQGGSCC